MQKVNTCLCLITQHALEMNAQADAVLTPLNRGSIWRTGQTLLETSGKPVQKISDLKPSTSVKGPARKARSPEGPQFKASHPPLRQGSGNRWLVWQLSTTCHGGCAGLDPHEGWFGFSTRPLSFQGTGLLATHKTFSSVPPCTC